MRTRLKSVLARTARGGAARGASVLIYHRVSGSSGDELDLAPAQFAAQVDVLRDHRVVPLDEAVASGSGVVLTFDDGFADVHENAWPLLREARLPFTVYLASGFVGGAMQWEGSTAKEQGAPALTWDQLREMVDSGLCTVGNHTRDHVRPEVLDEAQLDACSADVERELGVRPRHFAYTWGVPVPSMEQALRARFASAATGSLGRHRCGDDPVRLPRIPVRRTDPVEFFAAKLTGNLWPERTYAAVVAGAKRAGMSA